jgi:hypothetical protein
MPSLYPPQLMPLAFNNTLTTRGLCCGMGACSSHTTHGRVELPRHHSHGCCHSRHITIVTWGVVVPPTRGRHSHLAGRGEQARRLVQAGSVRRRTASCPLALG